MVRLLGRGVHGCRVLLELAGCRRDRSHDAHDLLLEGIGEFVQQLALARLGACIGLGLFGLQPLAFDESLAEMLGGAPDRPHLVPRAAGLDLDVVIAGRHLLQRARDPAERPAEEEGADPCG